MAAIGIRGFATKCGDFNVHSTRAIDQNNAEVCAHCLRIRENIQDLLGGSAGAGVVIFGRDAKEAIANAAADEVSFMPAAPEFLDDVQR
jgi:hypothetical protein